MNGILSKYGKLKVLTKM